METKQKKAVIQVRIDETVKRQAVAVLNNIGMDASTAINVFFRQIIEENGLPFQPKQANFNAETFAAIKESDNMVKNGTSELYTSVDEMFKEVLGE